MNIITRFSLKYPVVVVMLIVLIVVGGVYSVQQMKTEAMPDIAVPVIVLTTVYPGAGPTDVLEKVTEPLEKVLKGINGVKNLNSTSAEGMSAMSMQFDFNQDMDKAEQAVNEAVNRAILPDTALKPKVSRISFGSSPIIEMSASATGDPVTLQKLVDEQVVPELAGIDGVGEVQVSGTIDQNIYVRVLPEKLSQYGLTLTQVKQALQANNISFPTGEVAFSDKSIPLRVAGKLTTLEEIRNLSVTISLPTLTASSFASGMGGAVGNGISGMGMAPALITLSDIAEITPGSEKPAMITRTNSENSVVIKIVKEPNANVVEVADNISQKMADLRKTFSDGTRIDILLDQSISIKQSINSMLREGLLGALFAVIVIFIFLRNWRSTLVAVVSIPLSVVIALAVINQFGITLNIMTLGGLAIAIGRVVDDSIVVIENIYRRLQKGETGGANLISLATKEVSAAITSSTLTTVAVFLPLGLVSGMIGKIFMPFALTVVFSLLASLLVAVSVVPLLSKLLLLKHPPKHQGEGWLAQKYRRILAWSLHHKALITLLSVAILAASFALVPKIGTNFMPANKEKNFNLKIQFPAGTGLIKVNAKALEIEAVLKNIPEVDLYQTTVGSPKNQVSNRGQVQGSNEATMFVALKPDADVDIVSANVRNKLEALKGESTITLLNRSVMGSTEQMEVIVKGKDLAKIREFAATATAGIHEVEGLANVSNNLASSKPEININVKQNIAAMQGLSAIMVAGAIRDMLQDSTTTTVNLAGQSTTIMVGLKSDLSNMDKINDLEISGMTGKVKLREIASITLGEGPVSILHRDGEEFASITGDVVSKDTGAVSKAVEAKLATISLPEGVTYAMGGTTEQMNESFAEMGLAMLVAVVLVYVVMVIAFGGALAPLSILFSLPFATIGGLLALFITKQQISMASMIGALMLIGIVVTNAIVLVDRVQQQKRKGLDTEHALIEAGATRLRPILMTAIATIFALLPLAMGLDEGTLISKGLAVVVIGGLATSTLLTLVIVPIAYSFFDSIKARFVGSEPLL